jgi:uncharacterized protein YajQ (UPF0234 family)
MNLKQMARIVMSKILERDVSGKCDDCEDLVKKGEKERQKKVEKSGVESPDEYPSAPGAKSRNAPPGSMGGKV